MFLHGRGLRDGGQKRKCKVLDFQAVVIAKVLSSSSSSTVLYLEMQSQFGTIPHQSQSHTPIHSSHSTKKLSALRPQTLSNPVYPSKDATSSTRAQEGTIQPIIRRVHKQLSPSSSLALLNPFNPPANPNKTHSTSTRDSSSNSTAAATSSASCAATTYAPPFPIPLQNRKTLLPDHENIPKGSTLTRPSQTAGLPQHSPR